jgi:hypothetical protein
VSSADFIALVDTKLAELGHPVLAKHERVFCLTPERRRALERAIDTDLRGVLRPATPAFELAVMLARFGKLWSKPCP